MSKNRRKAVAGHFQTVSTASEGNDILPLCGLDTDKKYTLRTFPAGLSVKRFGALINFLLPVKLHPESFLLRLVDRFYRIPDCVERYEGTGGLFHAGIRLNNQFMGTWYNNQTSLLGDFGSRLYIIEET